MTCTSCGDKPKGSSKGFPRAVVEINNPESLVLLRKVVIPASMGTEEDVPPAIGKYFNVLLQYESNGHIYLYSSDGIPTAIEANIPQEVLDRIDQLEIDVDLLETGLAKETEDREKADEVLQQEIDDIKNSPDVVDIVATYSDLMAYDTSSLGNNDVIRVLRDETHDGQSAYYRWSTSTQTWTFIGTVGDYYTKQQIDDLLDEKQDELVAGENITIADESGSLVISATDTTYSNFVGTDGTAAGVAGLVPAPATTDAGKVLGANGSWVTGGPNVVQTTGTSTTDVMSQNATTSMIYASPSVEKRIRIGLSATNDDNTSIAIGESAAITSSADGGIAIGKSAAVSASKGIAIGNEAKAPIVAGLGGSKIAIGDSAKCYGLYSVCIGHNTLTSSSAEFTVAIGDEISATKTGGTLIGVRAAGGGEKATAVGTFANAAADGSVALGWHSEANAQGQVNIGVAAGYENGVGYNNSVYRLISGVYDGQNAHDAATKGQLDSAVTGIESELDSKQDVLTAGQGISIADESGDLVISATSTGPNVVQTTGTSTTDVMSQKATTDMVFSAGYNPATKPNDSVRVQIGRATSNSNASIAIGAGSPSNLASAGISANGSVVIGSSASSSEYGGVAIGYGAKATQRGQFDISATTNNSSHVWGYNGSDYRLLTGLYDPQSAHDAATKGYVDTAVAGAGASAFTTNEWNALWA